MIEKTCSTCNEVYKRDAGFKHRDGLCKSIVQERETAASIDIAPFAVSDRPIENLSYNEKINQKIESLKQELEKFENLKQQLESL